MNSDNNKNNVKENDDLVFVPLNVKEPFSQCNSSWIPSINFDKSNFNNLTNNIFIGLPPVIGSNCDLKLPEPSLIQKPLTPYPKVNDELNTYSKPKQPSMKEIGESDLMYPSEIAENELYSYNEVEELRTFNEDFESNPPHMEVLRNYDFSMEELDNTYDRHSIKSNTDVIFDKILKNNNGIFSTLKTYRIPYPIAALIVKRIIKLTLENISECKCDKDHKKNKRR